MLEKTRNRMVKRYAAQFMATVKRDAQGLLDAAVLPEIHCYKRVPLQFTSHPGIMFCLPMGKKGKKDRHEILQLAKAGFVKFGLGRTYNEGMAIEIFGYTYLSPEKLRETVRHEVLHAMLAQCGFPFGDDSELFRRLAAIYCA